MGEETTIEDGIWLTTHNEEEAGRYHGGGSKAYPSKILHDLQISHSKMNCIEASSDQPNQCPLPARQPPNQYKFLA
ncbi:hypothetical protein OUZ56_014824 [Daphnia magna]|uniref:Uncharacterized protein n=1 Tax=Daphnia magna TaxID=35525 RepID=A0ABR0AKY6_9CRUS|nr:hypothetical protein OUZ56_014824 [Daphnia magna]